MYHNRSTFLSFCSFSFFFKNKKTNNNKIYGLGQAKKYLRACAKSADLHHPLNMRKISSEHSVLSIDSVCGQLRLRSDCADTQSDQGLRCPHIPEDTFSHDAANIHMHSKSITMLVVAGIFFFFFSILTNKTTVCVPVS